MARTVGTNRFGALRGRRSDSAQPMAAEFERLYREAYPIVYNYAYRVVLNATAAEDVTAEAFLKAARAFGGFDATRAKFSTWVVAIARNCISDYFRTNHPTASIDEIPEDAGAYEEPVDRIYEKDATHRLLEALTAEERELVFLKYFEDKRNKDIAEELGLNPSTVATKLQRALAKMRSVAEGDEQWRT